jgi:hypothetical protein
MKNVKALPILMLTLFSLAFCTVKAQDMIVTVKGKTIHANIRKVKNDNIIYWKWFHRIKLPVRKVLYVQHSNGTKTEYNSVTTVKNYKSYCNSSTSNMLSKADSLAKKANTNMPQIANSHKYCIERIGQSYRLDTNQIVGTKGINQIMMQSGNPQVMVNLKAAKTMRALTTVSKIASVPGSAGGAFGSYFTFKNLYDQIKSGQTSFKSYMNAGLTFLGTLSLPITSGILTHIKNKLYDRTLDAYSAGK